MIRPCYEGDDHTTPWKFGMNTAWYARACMFFTAELKRKGGLPNLQVRLAYVRWYHRYTLDSGKLLSC